MALRKGDTVSLSVAPTFKLADFTMLKASASVTRCLGDDPDADIAEMRAEVRALYAAAVADELQSISEIATVLENEDIEGVAAWAAEKSSGSIQEKTNSDETAGSQEGRTEGGSRTRKVRRKKVVKRKPRRS